MIITNESPETPIQKKLGEVGKTLGMGCLAICAFIFVIGILKKIEPIEMFMTSVGLAVACNSRGVTRNSNNNAFYWSDKNGKEKYDN